MNSDYKMTVLRAGTNGFTCVPGDPKDLSKQTMCMDQPSKQWFSGYAQRRPKPTNIVPGITCMLAGGTQRSDTEPYDNTSPLIEIGPHWMIMWPFDPKATLLPTKHKPAGTHIKWAGSPYACLVVTGKPCESSRWLGLMRPLTAAPEPARSLHITGRKRIDIGAAGGV
jgi:hypothetical protein